MRHARTNIPIDHLRAYLDDVRDVAPYIISVGCGNGVYEFEATIHDPLLRKKLILVDPAPESYELWPPPGSSMGFLKPSYASTEELIRKRPEVVGNCVLLLIWIDVAEQFDYQAFNLLEPLSCVCMNEHVHGGSEYDSDTAIFKTNFLIYSMDPIRFADIIIKVGAELARSKSRSDDYMVKRALDMCSDDKSGGDYMGSAGSVNMNLVLIAPEMFGYKRMAQTRYGGTTTHGNMYPKLTWIAKKGSKVPKTKKSCEKRLQLQATAESDININGKKADSGYENFCSAVKYLTDPSFIAKFKLTEEEKAQPPKKRY